MSTLHTTPQILFDTFFPHSHLNILSFSPNKIFFKKLVSILIFTIDNTYDRGIWIFLF